MEKKKWSLRFRQAVLVKNMMEVAEYADESFYDDFDDLKEKCLLWLKTVHPEQDWRELSNYKEESWWLE